MDNTPEHQKALRERGLSYSKRCECEAPVPYQPISGPMRCHVCYLELPEPVQGESILQEAQRLVHGPRQGAYGHPFEDFTRTGRIWGAILGIPDVPPDKVALCLVGVKISREVNAPKRDNRVDMAGYAEALDLVRQRQDSAKLPDYDYLDESK